MADEAVVKTKQGPVRVERRRRPKAVTPVATAPAVDSTHEAVEVAGEAEAAPSPESVDRHEAAAESTAAPTVHTR